jgi:hypothetical protein
MSELRPAAPITLLIMSERRPAAPIKSAVPHDRMHIRHRHALELGASLKRVGANVRERVWQHDIAQRDAPTECGAADVRLASLA